MYKTICDICKEEVEQKNGMYVKQIWKISRPYHSGDREYDVCQDCLEKILLNKQNYGK